jgi:hypothetical protein
LLPAGLQPWQQVWALPADSITGQPEFLGKSVPERLAKAPQEIGSQDFRLAENSPGKRAGPEGRDLGADIELVGPGAAYHGWQQTPAYQE